MVFVKIIIVGLTQFIDSLPSHLGEGTPLPLGARVSTQILREITI